MTKNELAEILSGMYINSADGEAVAMIHLFGIKYALEIKESKATYRELAELANIPVSYATEISKGAKLSKFVKVIT